MKKCPDMKISYELKQEDFLEALLAHRNRNKLFKWARRIFIAIACLLLAVTLLSLFIRPSRETLMADIPFFVVVGFWIILVWALPRWTASKQFRGQPSAQGPRALSLDETGAHWKWSGGSADVEWKNFVRSIESENLILLYTSPVFFNVFPKRVLSTEELNSVRKMIEHNIPNRK